MEKRFYVDSCIYLNLWQKEISNTGIPFWKIAKEFFEKLEDENAVVYHSGYLLKELSFILNKEEFTKKKKMFESSPNFRRVMLSDKEFELAREIEIKVNKQISFYEIIHMILARKTNSILITRDKMLLQISKRFKVVAMKPEDLL
ncbi:MAG: PIN domain-containing protein [Candidatus Pacearchaeota archaeon]